MTGDESDVYDWIDKVEALSITCVHGLDSKASIKQLKLHRIGQTARSLDDAYDVLSDASDLLDQGPIQVFRKGDWTVIVELNGWLGTLSDSLEALSINDMAVNVFWNVNSVTQFAMAMAGTLLRQFEPTLGSEGIGEPLSAELGLDFDSPDVCLVSAMELMARLTGFALDEDELLSRERLCYHPDAKVARDAGNSESADDFLDNWRPDPEESRRRWLWRRVEPTERMLAVGGQHLPTLAREDWDLAEQVLDLDPEQQRKLAVWAAHWSVRFAGLGSDDRYEAALRALDDGQPLPAPFDSNDAYRDLSPAARAGGKRMIVGMSSRIVTIDTPREAMADWVGAIAAIRGAAEPDPVKAAINAVVGALSALADGSPLFADVRAFLAHDH